MLAKKIPCLFILFTAFFASTLMALPDCAPSFFFVVHAQQGKVVKMPDTSFQLQFNPVKQQVIYFSDRPKRITGSISVAKFLSIWSTGQDSLKADHPNGSIGVLSSELQTTNAVAYGALVISHPSYDAASNTLSFTIKPLKGSLSEEKMKYLTIFIDSVFGGISAFS